MTDTINGRTPEEIKRGLVDAIEEASWVVEGGDAHDLIDAVEKAHASMADALAYIQQLEHERDAAVEQLRRGYRECTSCKFSEDTPENNKVCGECRVTDDLLYSNWQWRGVQEVE